MKVWNSTTSKLIYYLPGHKGSVNDVSLVAMLIYYLIHIQCIYCLLLFFNILLFFRVGFNQVIFHPTEPIVASCGSDKTVLLGELE